MQHLNARGFRTEVGNETDWPAIRARFRIMPGFQSTHTAVVDGLYIEGPVPAGDIHDALQWRGNHALLGLVVPGAPPGAPGMESFFPRAYTVYAVRPGGLMETFAVHNHQ